MRNATAYNQRLDRQRLSFATCRKCGRRVAVLGLEGQDVGHSLYENGFRLANRIGLEIEMECLCCYEIEPIVFGRGLQDVIDSQRRFSKLIEKEMYGRWE